MEPTKLDSSINIFELEIYSNCFYTLGFNKNYYV